MNIILLILIVLIAIWISRIDNKLWKTKYWNLILLWIILVIIFHFVAWIIFWVKLMFDPIYKLIYLAWIILFSWLIWLWIILLISKAACLKKQDKYIIIAVYILYLIFDIYYSNFMLWHSIKYTLAELKFSSTWEDPNWIIEKVTYLNIISHTLNAMIGIIYWYISYKFSKRLQYDTRKSILVFLFPPLFYIYIWFSKKSLDNYQPCDWQKIENKPETNNNEKKLEK